MQGKEMPYTPESIRLFAFCSVTRFTHLPVAGGLYDQDPQLIDEWQLIFERRAEHQQRESEAKKVQQSLDQKKPPTRRRR